MILHATDVKTPCRSYECTGQGYKTVLSKFKSEGFENIILEPIYRTLGAKDFEKGKVQGISINGESFEENIWYPCDVEVRIAYYAEKTSFAGKDYKEAERLLKEMGFDNIITMPLEDLKNNKQRKVDDVEDVTVGGISFSDVAVYNTNSEVIITYHSGKILTEDMVVMNKSSRDYIGENYADAKAELIASGFDNVKAEPLSDLKNEWLHKDGAIKSITIDGQKKFGAGFFFDKHAEIVIKYHSFK